MKDGKIQNVIFVLAVALMLAAILGGCSGVIMNAEYSRLLDQTAALSAETAMRAQTGVLTEAQKTIALTEQANAWQKFRAARDGKDK